MNDGDNECGTYGCSIRRSDDQLYNTRHRDEADSSTLTMKIRIPSQHFTTFIHEIETIVEATNKNKDDKGLLNKQYFNWTISNIETSTRDVTNDYVDTIARANVINQSRQAIQAILSQATSISDVMKIQKEILRLTEEYESQKQRSITLQHLSVSSAETQFLFVRLELMCS